MKLPFRGAVWPGSFSVTTLVVCALGLSPLWAQVQESRSAGKWYPRDKAKLTALLDQAFETADSRAGGAPARWQLRALIAPHAAIRYSGVVAASAYRLLREPTNVIVLAFNHRGPVDGVVTPGVDGYSTPLGVIRVNRKAARELGFPELEGDPIADHSLKNQLPFLQRAAPSATVVPLYVGRLREPELRDAARRIARRLRDGDVLIASSDFTHYGEVYNYTPFPNDSKLRKHLSSLAMDAFEEIGSLRVSAFNRHLNATGDNICGRNPIRLLLATLNELDADIYMHLADYLTSGDLTGDYSTSVGYAAMAFYPASAYRLGPRDQARLLASARATLNRYLASGKKAPAPVPPANRDDILKLPAGVFVTIKKDNKLRGCVGSLSPRKPLWSLVADRTLAASTADKRFPPLTRKDGPVRIEISVLTPLKRIPEWDDYRLGYGAVLSLNGQGGLLLPQFAAEHGWTATEFLENLSRKAGHPPNGYRDPAARLYIYEAQVFAEPAASALSAPATEADGDHRLGGTSVIR